MGATLVIGAFLWFAWALGHVQGYDRAMHDAEKRRAER